MGPLKPRALHTVSHYFSQLQNQGSSYQENYLHNPMNTVKNVFALSIKRIPKKVIRQVFMFQFFLPQTQAKCCGVSRNLLCNKQHYTKCASLNYKLYLCFYIGHSLHTVSTHLHLPTCSLACLNSCQASYIGHFQTVVLAIFLFFSFLLVFRNVMEHSCTTWLHHPCYFCQELGTPSKKGSFRISIMIINNSFLRSSYSYSMSCLDTPERNCKVEFLVWYQ